MRKEFTDFQEKLKDCESAEEALALEKIQEKQFTKVSAELYQRLFTPLRESLGSAELLYLAPDSALNRLPFEALVDASGKYLIESRRCAYLSSGGRLKRLDNPLLRSGIVLAGANTIGDKEATARADDGWVTAEEVAQLNLRGTELVVLSACQTGLGDVTSGEGVFGLRRAFLFAGARTLVTSLFEVPDKDTRDLMRGFYANLKSGQGKLLALHAAQRQLMQTRRQASGAAHPFFWASFVMVGDAD